MFEKFFSSFEITPKHIKIFLFAFIVVAVSVSLKQLGVRAPFALPFP